MEMIGSQAKRPRRGRLTLTWRTRKSLILLGSDGQALDACLVAQEEAANFFPAASYRLR